MERCEFFGRPISQTAVRPEAVVVLAPRRNLPARVKQITEPADVQTLLAQPAIKALDVRVLDRFAWPDVHQFDPLLDRPSQKRPAGELRAVVAAQTLRRAALGNDSLQHPNGST